MKSGTMNEGAVFRSLQKQPYVDCIFECGLLQSRTHRIMAVSPDGVGMVYPPPQEQEDGVVPTPQEQPVLCSVEIKTRLAPHMIVQEQKCGALLSAMAHNKENSAVEYNSNKASLSYTIHTSLNTLNSRHSCLAYSATLVSAIA